MHTLNLCACVRFRVVIRPRLESTFKLCVRSHWCCLRRYTNLLRCLFIAFAHTGHMTMQCNCRLSQADVAAQEIQLFNPAGSNLYARTTVHTDSAAMQPRQPKGAVGDDSKSSQSRSCQATALQAIFAGCATFGIPRAQSKCVTADHKTAADAVHLVLSTGKIIGHEVIKSKHLQDTVKCCIETGRQGFICKSRQLSKNVKQTALLGHWLVMNHRRKRRVTVGVLAWLCLPCLGSSTNA